MKPAFRLALSAAALSFAGAVSAAPAYTATHGDVTFSATQMGVVMKGRFGTAQVQGSFNPADLAHSHLTVSVDTASIDAGGKDTDDLLKGPDWLDAPHFPKAVFVSDAFQAAGPGHYRVSGHFTVKGHTHPMTVVAATRSDAHGLHLDADFSIDRTTWGLGTGSWADPGVVAAALPVHVDLLLAPAR